jgi:ribosomal protein L40E
MSGGFRFRQVEGNPETMYAIIEGLGAVVLIKHSHLAFLRNVSSLIENGMCFTDEQVMSLQAVGILEILLGKEQTAKLRITNVIQVASSKEYVTESIADWDVPCWLIMLNDERQQNLERSEFMSKVCGVCGHEAGIDAIECPKCGRGVFTSEKDHCYSMKSVRSVSHTPGMTESRNIESRKHISFWKKLFAWKGRSKDQIHEHYQENHEKKLSHDQQLALFLPPIMLRVMSTAEGVLFNGVFVKIDGKVAEWALPFSERITSASRSFREGRGAAALKEFFEMSKILPTAAVILMNMGVCAAAIGEKEKAKQFLQWSLQNVPAEFRHIVTRNLAQL